MSREHVARRVSKVLTVYISVINKECPQITSSTRLIKELGLSSDDGVMIVLDLCTEFQIELPEDFNAAVHDDGGRDRTFDELVSCIDAIVSAKE